LPIEFTDAGIVSDDNDEHPEKQESGRDITDLGIITFLIFRQI
jgi:hypothetical protein